MKIVCISDTHGKHNMLDVPEGDVLLFAGDAELRNQLDTLEFCEWLMSIPIQHKYIICGNHDFYGERRRSEMKDIFAADAVYLENEGATLPNGMRIWGSPYTPVFFDWAFMKTHEQLMMNWMQIPADVDILLTHGPAYGFLDIGIPKYGNVGDKALADAIVTRRPKYHVHGHIHGSYGTMNYANTTHINCSVLDEKYRMVNKPIVIEV